MKSFPDIDDFLAEYREGLLNSFREIVREEIANARRDLPPELEVLLTLDQVAEYLGVKSSQTARSWLHRQGVKIRKIGSASRVLGADVHEALKRK